MLVFNIIKNEYGHKGAVDELPFGGLFDTTDSTNARSSPTLLKRVALADAEQCCIEPDVLVAVCEQEPPSWAKSEVRNDWGAPLVDMRDV